MSKREMKILDALFTLARDNDPVGNSRLAAAVVYKGRVISYGFNRDKTHPFQAQYSKNEEAIYWHAETNAIHNALKIVEPTGLHKMTLYVARAKYMMPNSDKWTWGNSRPCSGCMACAANYKMHRIVYTQNEYGNYGVIENVYP
jgi:tRNA(Arg) A34 adenosine deaminase TadA